MKRTERLRRGLLSWYKAEQRELPWRGRTDPYEIWISEIMLQQTRVDTVIPYYEKFLNKFPNLQALAAAEEETVRAAWSGLGYYRRAKLMHRAADLLVREHGAQWPLTAKELQKLPGFGRYTSGAVASIAFGEPVAAVDGNVMRVIARLQAIEADATKGKANAEVWEFAQQLATNSGAEPKGHTPGDFTQALIELGAMVCTSKSPACANCPVSTDCKALKKNLQSKIPPPRARAKRKTIELTAIVCHRRRSVLLEQRPATGIFAELWCLPLIEGDLEPDASLDELERRWHWRGDHAEDIGTIKHVLTHRDVFVRLVSIKSTSEVPQGFRWVDLEKLDELGIPSITSKLLEAGLPDSVLGSVQLPGRRTKKSPNKKNAQTKLFE